MGEILLFPSRPPERQARAPRATDGDPGLLICGAGETRIDCTIARIGGAEAELEGEMSGAQDATVLIDLAAGVAHYGRLQNNQDGRATLRILQSHDLEHDDTPRLLRLIWLDRVLIEGADTLAYRLHRPRPAC